MGNSSFLIGDTVYIIGRYVFEEHNPFFNVSNRKDRPSI